MAVVLKGWIRWSEREGGLRTTPLVGLGQYSEMERVGQEVVAVEGW